MEQEKSEPAKLVLINTFISCTSKGTSESDLGEMAQKIRNSRYNEKRFRALIIRKSNPQTTVLLFKSEKTLIFTSAPENSFPILAKTIEKEWQKVLNSKAIKITNLTVYNMMAKFQLGFKIDLGRLCEMGRGFKHDNMPGVMLKINEIQEYVKRVMVYASGKVQLFGATQMLNLEKAHAYLLKELPPFRLKPFTIQTFQEDS